jgi:beta-aspartyl-peptidase (threonine type)
MQYQGLSVQDAARRVVQEDLVKLGGPGTGGLIALDRAGHIAMELNTPGMYRGYTDADGTPHVLIYGDE